MGFLGAGHTDGEWVWVPIPKNATSAHRKLFIDHGWAKFYYGRTVTHLPAYIPIREPIARWFSGVAQHSARRGDLYNNIIEDVLGGGWPVLDDHTMPQTEFLLSTISDPRLIRLEDSKRFVEATWGLSLPVVNKRAPLIDERLVPVLTKFYAADIELYESIPPT